MTWPWPPATGCGSSAGHGAASEARNSQVGNNGDVVEILAQSDRRPARPNGEGGGCGHRLAPPCRQGNRPAVTGPRPCADDRRGAGSHVRRAYQRAAARDVWRHRVHELRRGKPGARHHMDADLRRRTARGRAAPPGRRRRHANHAGHSMGARCRGHVREALQGPWNRSPQRSPA